MTGKTHRAGGVLGCLVGYTVLQSNGMLIENVSPLVQLTIMYPFAYIGGTLPDMDHDWGSVPNRDLMSWVIWRILHLTTPIRRFLQKGRFRRGVYKRVEPFVDLLDSKHRSWQTHSDLSIIFLLCLSVFLQRLFSGTADGIILLLVFEGLIFGCLSHLVLDLLTPDGIWSFILTLICRVFGRKKKSLVKLRLVPNVKFMSTSEDGSWETIVRRVVVIMSVLVGVYVVYTLSPFRLSLTTKGFILVK